MAEALIALGMVAVALPGPGKEPLPASRAGLPFIYDDLAEAATIAHASHGVGTQDLQNKGDDAQAGIGGGLIVRAQ